MNLTDREKKLVLTAGLFFGLLIVVFGINFVKDNIVSLNEKILQSRSEEKSIVDLGIEYKKLSSLRSMEKIDLEPMVPFIESLMQKYNISSNTSLQPNDSVIENKFIKRLVNISFKEIDAASLLNIIKEIENQTSIPMTVELFQFFEIGSKPGFYRVMLRVAAFKNKE